MQQLSELLLDIRSSLHCLTGWLNLQQDPHTQEQLDSFEMDMACFMRHCLLMYNMVEDGAVQYTSPGHDILLSEAVGDVCLLKQAILNNSGSEQLQLLMDNADLLERTFQAMLSEIMEIRTLQNSSSKRSRTVF